MKTETAVRRPAVAGSFYPAERTALAALIARLLEGAAAPSLEHPVRSLVVPHAGYVYSGAAAAAGYAAIRGSLSVRGSVALAGPAHFVGLAGAAVPAAGWWATPLGETPVDAGLREVAVAAGARVDDRPHRPEHALEVQLPFLQVVVGPRLRILPVAVGPMPPEAAADLLSPLAEAADLLVISSDLSHYLDEATARGIDAATIRAIVGLDSAAIGDDAACGIFALRGVVELARRSGWRVTELARATSADAGAGRGRVVGYAALALG